MHNMLLIKKYMCEKYLENVSLISYSKFDYSEQIIHINRRIKNKFKTIKISLKKK